MKNTSIRMLLLAVLCMCLLITPALAEESSAVVAFAPEGVTIDGVMDDAYLAATPFTLGNAYDVTVVPGWFGNTVTYAPGDAANAPVVRAVWDGSMVSFFMEVKDATFTPAGGSYSDSVKLLFDLMYDHWNLTNEDDLFVTVPASGAAASVTKGDPAVERFAGNAAVQTADGYCLEAAVYVSDLGFKGGETIGFDAVAYDASGADYFTNTLLHTYTFNLENDVSGDNNDGLYGNLKLEKPTAAQWESRKLDTYVIKSLIAEAEGLPRGIWESEKELDAALGAAKKALSRSASQRDIDQKANALKAAIDGMRHVDPIMGLPDPHDTTPLTNLPDPFTFVNGQKVSTDNWEERAEEIRYMAQYYEWGTMPKKPDKVTASYDEASKTITINVTDNGKTVSFKAYLVLPTTTQTYFPEGKVPVYLSIDWGYFAIPGWEAFFPIDDVNFSSAGYAQMKFVYTDVASDNYDRGGVFYELYPYDASKYADRGVSIAWAWGVSRMIDALEYLDKHDETLAGKLDLNALGVGGSSRLGKAAFVAGMMDQRIGVTAPMQSGSGGAGVYRYVPEGGTEVLPHRVRNQGHSHNQMLRYFLEDRWFGPAYPNDILGERLPYDKNLVAASFAPRGLYLICCDNDYSNNPYGESISYEGAKPVYEFLNAADHLVLDLTSEPVGHSTSPAQYKRLIDFMDYYFYNDAMDETTTANINNNVYLNDGKYSIHGYGGLETMMENYTSPIILGFAQQPVDQYVAEGEKATFTAMTTVHKNLQVQWYINRGDGWKPIEGANTLTYTTSSARLENDGDRYRVEVTQGAAKIVSEPAMLHVNALPSTGDNTPLVMLIALMLLSLTGMMMIRRRRA